MRVVFSLFVICFLFLCDPFGLKSATKEGSVVIYSQIFSQFYKGSQPGEKQPGVGQDQIAVALLTDKSAESLADGYPVPLRSHGEVISKLLCAGARAVFVDLNFRWERLSGDAVEFANLLRMRPGPDGCRALSDDDIRKPGIAPVIIGHIPSSTSHCDPLSGPAETDCDRLPGFRDLRRLKDVATVVTLPEPETDLRYIPSETLPGGTLRISAAKALLEVMCRDGKSRPEICSAPDGFAERTMTVQWGRIVSPRDRALKQWLNGSCDPTQEPGHASSSTGSWLLRQASRLSSQLSYATPAETGYCPFHDTMVASDVVEAAQLGDTVAFESANLSGNEILSRHFSDRVAFYGISITGIGDTVRSPTIGRIPGVYVHAMALDNLITKGPRYWRDPPNYGWSLSAIFDFSMSIALLCIGALLERANSAEFKRVRARRKAAKDPDKRKAAKAFAIRQYRKHKWRGWIFLTLGMGAIGLLLSAEARVGSWPPNDWISLLAVLPLAKPPSLNRQEWTGQRSRWPIWLTVWKRRFRQRRLSGHFLG